MRLLNETIPAIGLTLDSYEILTMRLFGSLIYIELTDAGVASLADMYCAFFNIYTAPQIYIIAAAVMNSLLSSEFMLAKLYDTNAQWGTLTHTIQITPSLAEAKTTSLGAHFNFQWTTTHVLLTLYTVAIFWQGLLSSANSSASSHAKATDTLCRVMYSWIITSFDKVETAEEGIVLAILWPWCFLIVFTHLMTLTDHAVMFGFSEWGLPVTYGLVMLLEHGWSMGTYLFVYVAGAAGRRISLITAIEDAVALLILIARVLLQAVRGVIVGMFHFICREMLWNMSGYWTHNTVANSATTLAPQALPKTSPALQLLFDCTVTGGSFVIITAVMFLQLLFLLVSVWLFCKCWFTSWRKC